MLNEVAIDYNAALPGALAGLYQYYGQNQPMTNFTPPVEPDESPYFTTATLNQDSSQGTQLTVNITNTATHPPHFQTDLSARVYFNIHSLVQHGQDISAISTPVYYDAASQIDGHATSVSAPAKVKRTKRANVCTSVSVKSGSGAPTGTVTITITRNAGSYSSTTSYAYTGGQVCVSTGRLKKKGGYTVTVQYTSTTGTVYTDSTGAAGFDVFPKKRR